MADIQYFNPSDMGLYDSSLIIGRRRTGKTTLVEDLVRNSQLPCELFTGFEMHYPALGRIHHPDAATWRFSDIELHEVATFHGERAIVFDELPTTDNIYIRDDVRQLIFDGRGRRKRVICSEPMCGGVPGEIQGAFDYVFLFDEPRRDIREKLWERFGRPVFPTYHDFDVTFSRITDAGYFTAMVIHASAFGHNTRNTVFWYKVDVDLPPPYVDNDN